MLQRIIFPLWQLLPTLLLLSAITFADDGPQHIPTKETVTSSSDGLGSTWFKFAPSLGLERFPSSSFSSFSSSSSSFLSHPTHPRQKRQLFDGFQFSDIYRILNIRRPQRDDNGNSDFLGELDDAAAQMNDAFDANALEEEEKPADEAEEVKEADDEESTKDQYKYPPIIQQFVQPGPGAYQQPFGYPYPFAHPFAQPSGQNFSQQFAQPFAPWGFPFPPQYYNPSLFRAAQPVAAEEPSKSSGEKSEHADDDHSAATPSAHAAEEDHKPTRLTAHASMPVPVHVVAPNLRQPIPSFNLRQPYPLGHFNNPIRSRFAPRPVPFNHPAIPRLIPNQAFPPNFVPPQRPSTRASPGPTPVQRSEADSPAPAQSSNSRSDVPLRSQSWFSGYRRLVNGAQDRARDTRRNAGISDDRSLVSRFFGRRRRRRSASSARPTKEQINRRVRRGILDTISKAVSGKEIVGALDRMMEGSDNSLYPYTRAALMGYTGSTQTCEELYPQCPTSTDQMIYTLNNLRKYFPDGIPFRDRIPLPFRYLLP